MDERKKELKLKYDSKGDILYLSLGEPTKAYSEEGPNGMVLRKSMETDEVVGVTIIDFKRRGAEEESISVPLCLVAQPKADLVEV